MTVATIFLGIIAFAQLAFIVALLLLFKKIAESLVATQRAMEELTPKVGHLIDETSNRVSDLKGVTEGLSGATDDIRAITSRVRGGVEFVHSVPRSTALWAGLKAGLAVLASKKAKADGKGDHHESQD
jgi:uncharacterized protein YoxC